MNGPAALTFSEIAQWSTLTGNPILPWEVDVVKQLDNLWLAKVNEKKAKGK